MIRWPLDENGEGDSIWFHDGIALARKLYVLNADADARQSLLGNPRVVLDGSGKPTFEVDPLIAAHALEMDDDMWALSYGDRKRGDIYRRDGRGALIPCVVFDPPPAAWRIHAMRSLLPSLCEPGRQA